MHGGQLHNHRTGGGLLRKGERLVDNMVFITELRSFWQIVTVGEDDDDQESRDIFKAAQVSIGMFGVLSEVTLRVERKFYLRELRTSHDLKYCLDNMDKLVKTDGYVYVKMWMEFYNDFCILYHTNKTDNEVHETTGWVQSFLTVSSIQHGMDV